MAKKEKKIQKFYRAHEFNSIHFHISIQICFCDLIWIIYHWLNLNQFHERGSLERLRKEQLLHMNLA